MHHCWRCKTSLKAKKRQILPKKLIQPNAEASVTLCDSCDSWYSSAMIKSCKKGLQMAIPGYRDMEEQYRAAHRYLMRPGKREKKNLNRLAVTSPEQILEKFNALHAWHNVAGEFTRWGLTWFLVRHFGFICPEPQPLEIRRFDEGFCLVCKTKQNITLHHVIPRAFLGVMEDAPLVLAPLCYACHQSYEKKASKLKKFILGAVHDHPLVMARGAVWAYLDGRIQDPALKFQIRCEFFDLIEGGDVNISQEQFFRLSREDLIALSAQTDLFGQRLMKLICENVPANLVINSWLAHFSAHCLENPNVDKAPDNGIMSIVCDV